MASVDVSSRQLGGRLAGLTLRQQVWSLAIWPLAEQGLNLLVGTVDLVLAGHLQPPATAISATDALGVATFFNWLLGIIHSALGIGVAALIARAVGARHRRLANSALAQAVLLAAGLGLVTGVFLLGGAPLLTWASGLEGEGQALGVTYLRIVALAAPAHALLLVCNAALRAAGNTQRPFQVMLAVNLLNAALSVAFVYAPAPIGGHGVAGIAAGTLGAWLLGALLVLVNVARGGGEIRLRWIRLRPHLHTMQRICRVGLPNLVETLGGTWLSTFLVLCIVGRLAGEGLIGAHMIVIRVESFAFQPGFALGMAGATLCGQYLGLGDPVRARAAVALCWRYAALLMGTAGLFIALFPRPLASVFTHAQPLIDQTILPLRMAGLVQVFFACYAVFSTALRGAGDTTATMKMTWVSVFTIRVPGAYVLGHLLGGGLPGVWLALTLDMASRGLLFTGRFLHGGWTKVKV